MIDFEEIVNFLYMAQELTKWALSEWVTVGGIDGMKVGDFKQF